MPQVLLVSGSTRSASSNSALLRTAVACAPEGVSAVLYDGLTALPHFNPDDDHEPLPPAVLGLRAALSAAHAVLFCTPEYAGTLPGAFKNLLDWTVGGTEMSDKPVGWLNAAADARRGHGAASTLATVLGYVQATTVPSACRHIPVPPGAVGADGVIGDKAVRAELAAALTALVSDPAV